MFEIEKIFEEVLGFVRLIGEQTIQTQSMDGKFEGLHLDPEIYD